MSGETSLELLVKNLTPVLNKGRYVFSTVQSLEGINREDTLCEIKEPEGITVIIDQEKADKLNLEYQYVASWITLMIHSSLEAVGLTALFSKELTKHNISCNVIAGYYHDHIFVDIKYTDKVMQILNALSNAE